MSATKNVPAFPQIQDAEYNGLRTKFNGLTKREYFAGQIMAGWASQGVATIPNLAGAARAACEVADALLEALGEK